MDEATGSGEEVVITRHGRAVARLVPADSGQGRVAAEAAAAMRAQIEAWHAFQLSEAPRLERAK